jgi:hypothetical protein
MYGEIVYSIAVFNGYLMAIAKMTKALISQPNAWHFNWQKGQRIAAR